MNRRDFMRFSSAVALSTSAGILPAFGQSMPGGAGPWIPLFNGKNLDGWDYFQQGVGFKDTTNAVTVHDGMIHMLGPQHTGGDAPGFGHIVTPREYGNYHLRVEYKFGEKRFEPRLLAKRNSGLLYHTFPERDRVWPNSVEFQFEESDVGDAILMNTRCWPGANLGGTPAWPNQGGVAPRSTFTISEPRQPIERQHLYKNGNFEKLGDWNTIELIAIGDKSAHLVNGRIVNSLYEIVGQDVNDRNVYRPLTKGRLALELEGAEVFFRKVEIRVFS
jgi:Domain of Unknown Function (DUF1080)